MTAQPKQRLQSWAAENSPRNAPKITNYGPQSKRSVKHMGYAGSLALKILLNGHNISPQHPQSKSLQAATVFKSFLLRKIRRHQEHHSRSTHPSPMMFLDQHLPLTLKLTHLTVIPPSNNMGWPLIGSCGRLCQQMGTKYGRSHLPHQKKMLQPQKLL